MHTQLHPPHRTVVRRDAVDQQRGLPLPVGFVHPDAQGESMRCVFAASVAPCTDQLQATMPIVVFAVGCGFGTERFSMGMAGNMVIVSVGIGIASYGEQEDRDRSVTCELVKRCAPLARQAR